MLIITLIKVKGTALSLLGGIIWRATPGSIKIRTNEGNPANMLWVNIDNKTYVFAYNHMTKKIEIRDRTQNGTALYSFDDTNSVADIELALRSL